MPASSESLKPVSYRFVDREPFTGAPSGGLNYYRLKIKDQDNTYSDISSLVFGQGSAAYTYPNPVSDELHLQMKDWSRVSGVTLYNANCPLRPGKKTGRSPP